MTTLPPEITVETLEDGFRYTLPTRRFVRLAGKSPPKRGIVRPRLEART
jgi:hypothetical protein